ncbi:outer membrane lipoprotein carrier protein LolA [Acetobacter fabarum]|uniref:LolA family protein n=1 Tax=Acetobacter fabarum TaxID=483199 RepID=UPI00312B8632
MIRVFRAVAPLCAGLLLLAGAAHAQDAEGSAEAATTSAVAPARLSAADKAWVARIEQELNHSLTFKARIQQVDAEGKRTTGTVWMKRPGQMRLAYDPPSPLLLVANQGKVVFRDSQLDQTTVIPMDRTPLGLLLAPHVSLSDGVIITAFRHEAGLVAVKLVRTASPGDGSLTLVFYETPLALRSWSVLDAQGRETRVTLFDVHPGADIPASMFDLPAQPEE